MGQRLSAGLSQAGRAGTLADLSPSQRREHGVSCAQFSAQAGDAGIDTGWLLAALKDDLIKIGAKVLNLGRYSPGWPRSQFLETCSPIFSGWSPSCGPRQPARRDKLFLCYAFEQPEQCILKTLNSPFLVRRRRARARSRPIRLELLTAAGGCQEVVLSAAAFFSMMHTKAIRCMSARVAAQRS